MVPLPQIGADSGAKGQLRDCEPRFESLSEGLCDNLTFAALCSFATAAFLLAVYFLPVAVAFQLGGEAGHNPTLAYYP